MSHFRVIFAIAALSLAGCQPVEEKTETADTTATNFTLSKKCNDGTDVYIRDGGYAVWDGAGGYWINLSPDVTPDDYCNQCLFAPEAEWFTRASKTHDCRFNPCQGRQNLI